MNNVFFTSDTHFFHEKVIAYNNRPFDNIEHMNDQLVDNWNDKVGRGDRVYHNGDFAFSWRSSDKEKIEKLIGRLNGQIHLVLGNHDRKEVARANGFVSVRRYNTINIGGQKVVLFHYPISQFQSEHHESWHLHGHCHGTLKEDPSRYILDVGVDCHNYYPISFDEVKELMSKKTVSFDNDHRNRR